MPTLPMKIGVPLDEMSILFFASLGAAIWLVYLFCQRKFAERSNTRETATSSINYCRGNWRRERNIPRASSFTSDRWP